MILSELPALVAPIPSLACNANAIAGGYIVENVIKDDAECLAMFREAMKANRGGDHTTEEGKLLAKHTNSMDCLAIQGTTRAYSISRVQRECAPEVVKQHDLPHNNVIASSRLRGHQDAGGNHDNIVDAKSDAGPCYIAAIEALNP